MAKPKSALPAGIDAAAYKKGMETYHAYFGFERDMRQAAESEYFIVEGVFGRIYARQQGGLSLRQRSLLTISVNGALGRITELRHHLRGSRHLGISGEELLALAQLTAEIAGGDVAAAALGAALDAKPPFEIGTFRARLAPDDAELCRVAMLAAVGTEGQIAESLSAWRKRLKTAAPRARALERLTEVCLQTAYYAGWPAHNVAMRAVKAVFKPEFAQALKALQGGGHSR